MADITKCANKDCELRKTCYRYLAKSNQYKQSIAMYNPIVVKFLPDGTIGYSCQYYWKVDSNKISK